MWGRLGVILNANRKEFEFLEQVLHLLHEVGVGVIFRLLLLWRSSHLASTGLGPSLQVKLIEC